MTRGPAKALTKIRGQASLELFFTLSLFILVLLWFNNFLQTAANHTQDALVAQEDQAAANVANVANAACILGENLEILTPCVFNGPHAFAYNLAFFGKTVQVGQRQALATCALAPAALSVNQCNRPVCIGFGTPVQIREGPCP